ncbi:hypothetical protein BCS42_02765 [Crenothrix sp. D3]|nr:hypothetical protein BCS42_02765 [Crenothrix sp. D3]
MTQQPCIKKTINRPLRLLVMLIMVLSLSGCMYWVRAYQTYLQMDEFDSHFSFSVTPAGDFTLNFKEPILFSEDFVSLSKLYASEDTVTPEGRRWRYWFRKLDAKGKIIKPEIKFYSDLYFNQEKKITAWSFSKLFLQIAPQKFLEASLRAIGGGKIDKEKRQLRANPEGLEKIADALPKKAAVIAQLGEPLSIVNEPDKEIYVYRFLLETPLVEKGYEDRVFNDVNITFDKKTQDLIRMKGRFAGLKASINYRKFQENPAE